MKPIPLALVFAAIGVVIGVVQGARDVGTVEDRLFPPVKEREDADPSKQADVPVLAPQVEIDQATYDFGQMQRGTSESHAFLVTNTGGAPLRVEVLKTTCKCTVGESPTEMIPPGGSAPVRLEWVAKTNAGSFRQVATIKTNDPWRETLKLTVEGKVVEAASLRPGQFALGRIASSRVERAVLHVLAFEKDQEPLRVTARMSETSRDPERYRLDVQPIKPEEAGASSAFEAVRVTLEAGPGLPIGSLLDWVTIETNLPDPKSGAGETLTFQAPVIGTVRGDISVRGAKFSSEQSRLNLGRVKSSEGVEAKLFFSFKGEYAETLRGELVEADPEWLEVDFDPPKQAREGVFHQFFTVRVPPGRPTEVRSGAGEESGGLGEGDAVLRFKTGHPTTPELDVKVRFLIAE